MAEFRIDLKESIRIKKEFTAIIKELKDFEKRLYAVKDNLSSMSEYKEIVNRLDRQCQEVTEERKDVEKLLQTFSDCVKCYENAEKKVKEQEIDWHFVLDAAGLIPGIGAAFDGVNTAWYAAEGDWSNALLSGMAFAPGIGEVVGGGKTAVKAGGKVIGHLDDAADIAKAADKAGDTAKAAGKAKKAGNGAGELGKYVDEAVESGTSTIKYKEVKTFAAEETNQWFIDNVKPDYRPPYKPETVVKEIELTENTTFVRVYDNMPDGSGMYGSWLMKAEDIEGLTPLEIQNKFALPNIPKYVCDVELEAGTHIRVGEVNPLEGWGSGGGTQYDLIGQRIGNFINERLLEGN